MTTSPVTSPVVRRVELPFPPEPILLDSSPAHLRIPTDEEMEIRLHVCRDLINREARRAANGQYLLEEAVSDAEQGVYQAARHDKFMPSISLKGYTAYWIRARVRRERNERRRSVVGCPPKDLGWRCSNAACNNNRARIDIATATVETDDDIPVCPICGAPLAKNMPPKCSSLAQKSHFDSGNGETREVQDDIIDQRQICPELKIAYQRIVEELRASADGNRGAMGSNSQLQILMDTLEGYGQNDIAERRQVTRQLIHMALTKIKGRALEKLLDELPEEILYRLIPRDVVDATLDAYWSQIDRAAQRRLRSSEKKAKKRAAERAAQ